MWLNGRKIKAIIDTGSAKNIIRRDSVKYFIKSSSHSKFFTAGGFEISVLGYADLNLCMENYKINCTASVINKSPYSLILGMEFLNQMSAVIDLQAKTLQLYVNGSLLTVNLQTGQLSNNMGSNNSHRKRHEPSNYKHADLQHCAESNIYKQLYHSQCVTDITKALSTTKLNCQQEVEPESLKRAKSNFDEFWKTLQRNSKITCQGKLVLETIDLFKVPPDYSLAHCISVDAKMGNGIAAKFKEFFNHTELLRASQMRVGDVIAIEEHPRTIFYLITKNRYFEKPSYRTLFDTLENLKHCLVKRNIKKLAMPRIGCGLDRLDWDIVFNMIKYVLRDVHLEILISVWNPKKKTRQFKRRMPAVNTDSPGDAIKGKHEPDNWVSLPLEESSTVVITNLKVRARGKQVIQPYREEPVEVVLDSTKLAENDQPLEFHINDSFFRNKRLLCTSGIYRQGLSTYLNVTSKCGHPVVIFEGTTLGNVEINGTDNKASPLLCQKMGIADVDMVTLEDHDLSNIKDPRLKRQLMDLLKKYNDVFAKNMKYMGRTNLVEHDIELLDNTPVRSQPYRISQKEREIIMEQIEEMSANNIISPSNSPYASPVVLVKKKDGQMRFCVDYRKLNEKTKKSNYPLPNIDDIMTYFGGSTLYSSLDLLSGYWQIEMSETAKKLTAFVVPGLGEWNFEVMPFGLTGAPGTFQALADKVFEGLKWKDILIYLDDIVIFSKTPEEHLVKLEKVFQRLRDAGLTLKPSKCEYMKEEINILGFKINKTGILPDDSKVVAINRLPTPKKLKDLQSFLGAVNFYRKFIEGFSTIARPLHDLTKKNAKFIWGSTQEKAFITLKERLTTAPVLRHFNPEKGTILHVDASRVGIGGILLQEDDNGVPHPIAYVSRSLSSNEKNYTISEMEGLAVVWTLGYLRHLIWGRPINIISDHSALCWLKSIKNSGRLCRWSIALAEFDYTVSHRKGCSHKDADCLSRYPVLKENEGIRRKVLEDIPTLVLGTLNTRNTAENRENCSLLLTPESIKTLQQQDKDIRLLVDTINNPEGANLCLSKRAKQFKIKEGVLYKINHSDRGGPELLVIPKSLTGEILFQNHNDPLSGHLGVTRTLQRINNRFYWDTLAKDVARYVRGCIDCQARKGSKKKPAGQLQPISVGLPFEKVGVDLLGPFKRSIDGKTVVIVCTDYATRYVETGALANGKAVHVARFLLDNVISRHGAPRIIVSDQGKTFQSDLVQELLRMMGVVSRFTTSYHPSCNGLTERLNGTLSGMLAMYTNTAQTDWSLYLAQVTFAYNSTPQGTTRFSPFELVFARHPVFPCEANLLKPCTNINAEEMRQRALAVRCLAVENICEKQKIDKKIFDEKHRHLEFNVGDMVKIFTPIRKIGKSEKLLLRFFGPYFIEEKIGEVDYMVRKGRTKNAKVEKIHVSRILPYYDPWTPPPDQEEEEQAGLPVQQDISDVQDNSGEENLIVDTDEIIDNLMEKNDDQNVLLLATNRDQPVDKTGYYMEKLKNVGYKFVDDIGWPVMRLNASDGSYNARNNNYFVVQAATRQKVQLEDTRKFGKKPKGLPELATTRLLGNGELGASASNGDDIGTDLRVDQQAHVDETVLYDTCKETWARKLKIFLINGSPTIMWDHINIVDEGARIGNSLCNTRGSGVEVSDVETVVNMGMNDPRREERRGNLSSLICKVAERKALSSEYVGSMETIESPRKGIECSCGIM